MSESRVQYEVRLALGLEHDVCLWRNAAGAIRDPRGKIVGKFGLVVGASDLIGIHSAPVEVFAPGTIVGRFFAIEMKTEAKGSKESDEQLRFQQLVRLRGGFAATARTVAEAVAALQRARTGSNQ